MGSHFVQFVHDELHDLAGRRTFDVVGLGVGERGGYQRHIAIGAQQFKVEVRTEETEFVREQFHLGHPLGIVRVVLPLRNIGLVQLFQEHAHVGNGRVALGPGTGIGVGGTPATVYVVVYCTGFQGILSLIGSTCQEVGAVGFELVVVHLCVNVEYHIFDTILEVFVCPLLVTRVFLGIVEVCAGERNDAGENE